MQSWVLSKFIFEVGDSDLKILATTSGAKILFGGKVRVLKFSDISSINLIVKKGANGTYGYLDFSDIYGASKIQFDNKSSQIAEEIFSVLSKMCPDVVGKPKSKRSWTAQTAAYLDSRAEQQNLSVADLVDPDKVLAAKNAQKEVKAKKKAEALAVKAEVQAHADSDAKKVAIIRAEVRAAEKVNAKATLAEKAAAKSIAKEAAKKASAEKLAARAKAKADAEAAALEKYGRLVFAALIQDGMAVRRVAIYEKCYVKLGSHYERLLGVGGDSQISKKTGFGRTVGTLATFVTPFPGINLMSPGQRGNVWLTLVTEAGTYHYSTDVVQPSTVKNYQGLTAAAQTVLNMQNQNAESANGRHENASDLAQKIKDISNLHDQGILTDEEFARAKEKLIEQG